MQSKCKFIFFGTPHFAAALLEYLIKENILPIAIVTQPDRERGRFQNLSFSAVKNTAVELAPSIPIFQPEKASNPAFIQEIALLSPDLFVVVGYGQILKQDLLNVPKFGSINVHASLLPKYRGAAPIQRCLMDGQKKTGITMMKIIPELDAGDILGVSEIAISEDMNTGELTEKLLEIAKPLLKNTLLKFEKGAVSGTKQNNHDATYAKKLTPEEFQIAWDFPASKVHNLVRALSPKPGAWSWAQIEGERKRVKILKTKLTFLKGEAPGEVMKHPDYPLVINCLDSALAILEVQMEGKKAMDPSSFLRGIKGKITF
ncbi:MAG TPA: methionyl-tRNA formyltransferase [Chlamydiales bacterium]|nr:methionyl-tRNA formyltransferase [Chlamydiales bacterium]